MKRHGYSVFRSVNLILRYLSGEISEQEKSEYIRMIEDTGLRPSDWARDALLNGLSAENDFDTKTAYNHFLSKVSPKPRVRRWTRRWIAALWIFPLIIGGVFWKINREEPEKKIEKQIFPVSSKAYVELADGRSIDLTASTDSLSEKDGTLILRDSTRLVYSGKNKTSGQLIYNVLNVPRGGEFSLILADGTRVWVNSDSRLRYPVHFENGKREVFLQGEAYFEVARDTKHPFVVHTSLGQIEVLGTEFNIQDYADESQVITTLVNGVVRYASTDGENCILKPGFQVVDKVGIENLQICEVNLDEYVGWKNGLYVFYDDTLEKIMQRISRNYDVEVEFENENLKKLRFSGELERYNQVEAFLRIVELGGDAVFVVEGKKIKIEPK